MKKHVTVLSLGAGIQSTALAILLEREAIPDCPKPHWAIFADTMAEPDRVYRTIEWLADIVSFPIIRTSWGDLAANTWKALRGQPVPERGHHDGGYIDLPVFSSSGLARRQCTGVYKIRPIRAKIRELADAAPPALTATQYLGISTNEQRRAKPSDVKWLTNRYPLIEAGWNRHQLQQFLDNNFPQHPVKRSACYFCPFHTNAEWLEIKELYPAMYTDAIAMERAMADHSPGPWFLKNGGLEKTMERADQQMALSLETP